MFFNSGIGIDIENHKVSIAYLKGSVKGVQLAAESSGLLDESKPVSERIRDAAIFINGFINERRIPSISTFIGIPGQYCALREIEFPLAVKENLRATLEYEMEKYIPLSMEDIYFDYQIISEEKAQQRLKVMIAVVKKEHAEPYLQLADLLGRGGSGIEIAPAAISNFFLYQYGPTDDPAIIVAVRDKSFDVIHLHNGAVIYSRTVDVTDEEPDWDQLIVSHLGQVRQLFSQNVQVFKLCIYGRALEEDISRRLKEDFQFDVLAPKSDEFGLSGASSISAVGLALRGIRSLPVQMNIMPVHLRKKPDKTSLVVMIMLAIVFAISGILWVGSHVMKQHAIIARMDQEVERLKSDAAQVETMRESLKKYQAKIDYLSTLRPGNAYIADIAKELSDRIPASAWIKELKLSGDQLSLYGIADSASELIPLLEESPVFSDVKFMSTIRKGKDDKEIFRIGLQIQNTQ